MRLLYYMRLLFGMKIDDPKYDIGYVDYKTNLIGFMPLTQKGKKVKKAVTKFYGKKKGESVFYAMENKKKGLAKK